MKLINFIVKVPIRASVLCAVAVHDVSVIAVCYIAVSSFSAGVACTVAVPRIASPFWIRGSSLSIVF